MPVGSARQWMLRWGPRVQCLEVSSPLHSSSGLWASFSYFPKCSQLFFAVVTSSRCFEMWWPFVFFSSVCFSSLFTCLNTVATGKRILRVQQLAGIFFLFILCLYFFFMAAFLNGMFISMDLIFKTKCFETNFANSCCKGQPRPETFRICISDCVPAKAVYERGSWPTQDSKTAVLNSWSVLMSPQALPPAQTSPVPLFLKQTCNFLSGLNTVTWGICMWWNRPRSHLSPFLLHLLPAVTSLGKLWHLPAKPTHLWVCFQWHFVHLL